MSKMVLVRGARQLLTLVGPPGPRRGAAMRRLGIIEDGAVLVVDGVITDVGPSRRVERLAAARDAFEIDASGKVVMPGFIDACTRLVAGPSRLDDYENGVRADRREAVLENVRHVRAYSKQRMSLEARKQVRQFVRHGTTTLEARSGFGLDEPTEMKLLRVLDELDNHPLSVSPAFSGAWMCPPEYEGRPDDYVEWIASHMIPEVQRRRLARFVDVSCGTFAGFTAGQAGRVLEAARLHGFSVRVSTGTCSGCAGAVALAVGHQAASIEGLEKAEPSEIEALARSGTVATLLPGRAFHQGAEHTPLARTLIDGGATVALASGFDSMAGPSCSMPMMLSLACAHLKMTPGEAIVAATLNAACALRVEHRAGSLESGKDADMLLLNAGDYREAPFRFGINPVAMVMRRGEIVYPRLEAT